MTSPPDTASGSAVRCVRAQPLRLGRLVCCPHAGGGADAYRRWASSFAPDIELWTVTPPGRGAQSPAIAESSWGSLVDELADAVGAIDGAEPIALLGHSFGALVAFEVARELERR